MNDVELRKQFDERMQETKARAEQTKAIFVSGTIARAEANLRAIAERAEKFQSDLADLQRFMDMLIADSQSIKSLVNAARDEVISDFISTDWRGTFQNDQQLTAWLAGQINDLSSRVRVQTTVKLTAQGFENADSTQQFSDLVVRAQNRTSGMKLT